MVCIINICNNMKYKYHNNGTLHKRGTIQMQIDRFKGENAKYESSLVQLRSSRDRISNEVKGIQESVHNLNKDVDELQENMKQYDSLRKDLEEIAGDNQDIHDMINEINGMYSGMKSAIIQNQRSSILDIFYDVQFKDKEKVYQVVNINDLKVD